MSGYNSPKTIDKQSLIYDEIVWEKSIINQSAESIRDLGLQTINWKPVDSSNVVKTGMLQSLRRPYWNFEYEVNGTSGLAVWNIQAKDTQNAGSSESIENVFELIDFSDFNILFDDGSSTYFNIDNSLKNENSWFELSELGTRFTIVPNDRLFQWGLKLVLIENVLKDIDGVCNVKLEISIVFRGANNDFDPGKVPVAMDLWPQIAYTWFEENATKRVKKFKGSVRLSAINTMFPGHSQPGAPSGNTVSLFTDSNNSLNSVLRKKAYGLTSELAGKFGMPASWGTIFDYVLLDLDKEKEFVGTYGPDDSNFVDQKRVKNYTWLPSYSYPFFHGGIMYTINGIPIELEKKFRQGQYDNLHLHARMPVLPQPFCQDEQIHAPFCGHSCIHFHWRWSSFSVNGALSGANNEKRDWQFRGWSDPVELESPFGTEYIAPQANAQIDSPLIPPNQRLTIAVTSPLSQRFNEDNIIDPASPKNLDSQQKDIWYSVDIIDPSPGFLVDSQTNKYNNKQVILENGLGWSFRYSKPSESDAIKGLGVKYLMTGISWIINPPMNHELANFFEKEVYPDMRYIDNCLQQVPDGSFDDGQNSGKPKMEDL